MLLRDYFKPKIVLRGKEDHSATKEKGLAKGIIYLHRKIKLNKFNGLVEFSHKENRGRQCSQVKREDFGIPFKNRSVAVAEVLVQSVSKSIQWIPREVFRGILKRGLKRK